MVKYDGWMRCLSGKAVTLTINQNTARCRASEGRRYFIRKCEYHGGSGRKVRGCGGLRTWRTPHKCESPKSQKYIQTKPRKHQRDSFHPVFVRVSSLWIAGYETGHSLASSSSWEVVSYGEPPIYTLGFCDIEWESFDLSINRRRGLPRFVWRASDNSVRSAVGVWKTAWEMKGFLSTNGCKCNIVS